MKTQDVKESIVEFLGGKLPAPPTAAQIAEALRLQGAQRKRLQKVLSELQKEGHIVVVRKNRYALGEETDLVSGLIQFARSGNAFVETDAGSVFIPSEATGTALQGDRVLVRIEDAGAGVPSDARPRRTRTGPVGRVIRILERSRRDIVGTLKSTGRFLYVLPIDPVYQHDFYVPDAADADIEDRVVVRFTGWQSRHVSPEGEIVEVLGPADQPSGDTVAVMRQYGYADGFPPQVVREAESASALMDKPGKRENLRGTFILTIDPVKSRDYDDALSLERDSKGLRVLGVHIADVSYFVPKEGELDKEARERGNSVYLPDRVLPMLPEQLSNGVCSLRPGVDRLTFSVFITFSDQGEALNRRFARTVIRSGARLTYDQAMGALEKRKDGTDEARRAHDSTEIGKRTAAVLKDLDVLAQQLRQRRFAKHALDIDVRECEIEVGPDGMVTEVRLERNDRSHQLIEECMVAANEAVAVELGDRGIKAIARFHEPPKEERLRELAEELKGMGYNPGNLSEPANLASFLRSIKEDPLAHHVRIAVLKSMNRAVYSASQRGHFGLAKAFYTHFTSPIRRYPDLVIHRLLAAAVCDGSGKGGRRSLLYPAGKLDDIAAHCSDTERKAEDAERTLTEIKKCRYLAQQLEAAPEREYEAVVAGVTNFGMFVELSELQIEGLVHISGISDRFVRYDRNRGTLKSGKTVYKVGTRIVVRVMDVNLDKRQIDFKLV